MVEGFFFHVVVFYLERNLATSTPKTDPIHDDTQYETIPL